MRTDYARCVRENCEAIGTKHRDEGWFCEKHDQLIRDRDEAARLRAASVQGYMQTIFVQYVARGSALEEHTPEAARKHLRWLKEQARMAAEVLFEDES